MLDALFAAPLLPFTVPALLALVLWLVASFGLVSFDGDADFDLDLDVEADAPFLSWLGLGTVPAFLLVTLFLFAFGWSGIGLHGLLGGLFGLDGWAATGATLPVALLAGLGTTGVLSRPLGRLFKTEEAAKRKTLVGRTATVSSGTLTDTFGSVTLRTASGPVEVSARVEPGVSLAYGQKVLVYEHDEALNLYFVAPYAE